MGNLLYGDLDGSEHMIINASNVSSGMISNIYTSCRSRMAGYCSVSPRQGLWYYVEKYNDRNGGYLSGQVADKIAMPIENFRTLTFNTSAEFENKSEFGTKRIGVVESMHVDHAHAALILNQLFEAIVRDGTVWLAFENLSSSDSDFISLSFGYIRQVVAVLPPLVRHMVSFVSNITSTNINGFKANIAVLNSKYFSDLATSARQIHDRVIVCNKVIDEPHADVYIKYLANLATKQSAPNENIEKILNKYILRDVFIKNPEEVTIYFKLFRMAQIMLEGKRNPEAYMAVYTELRRYKCFNYKADKFVMQMEEAYNKHNSEQQHIKEQQLQQQQQQQQKIAAAKAKQETDVFDREVDALKKMSDEILELQDEVAGIENNISELRQKIELMQNECNTKSAVIDDRMDNFQSLCEKLLEDIAEHTNGDSSRAGMLSDYFHKLKIIGYDGHIPSAGTAERVRTSPVTASGYDDAMPPATIKTGPDTVDPFAQNSNSSVFETKGQVSLVKDHLMKNGMSDPGANDFDISFSGNNLQSQIQNVYSAKKARTFSGQSGLENAGVYSPQNNTASQDDVYADDEAIQRLKGIYMQLDTTQSWKPKAEQERWFEIKPRKDSLSDKVVFNNDRNRKAFETAMGSMIWGNAQDSINQPNKAAIKSAGENLFPTAHSLAEILFIREIGSLYIDVNNQLDLNRATYGKVERTDAIVLAEKAIRLLNCTHDELENVMADIDTYITDTLRDSLQKPASMYYILLYYLSYFTFYIALEFPQVSAFSAALESNKSYCKDIKALDLYTKLSRIGSRLADDEAGIIKLIRETVYSFLSQNNNRGSKGQSDFMENLRQL